MSTSYKHWVREQLEPLLDAGATQRELATRLGLANPNFLSMILGDSCPESMLPLSRLPALCTLCGLSAMESLRGVRKLLDSGARRGVHFDVPTFEWMLRCTALALRDCHAGA